MKIEQTITTLDGIWLNPTYKLSNEESYAIRQGIIGLQTIKAWRKSYDDDKLELLSGETKE